MPETVFAILDAAIAVRDVVAQGRFAHQDGWGRPSRADSDAVGGAMERTDIHTLGDRLFNELSYGERRRVLLARALATGAKLLWNHFKISLDAWLMAAILLAPRKQPLSYCPPWPASAASEEAESVPAARSIVPVSPRKRAVSAATSPKS